MRRGRGLMIEGSPIGLITLGMGLAKSAGGVSAALTVLTSGGSSYSAALAVLTSSGASYTVTNSVRAADGTAYVVI